MPNINEWLAAGRPDRVNVMGPWTYHGCQCNPMLEHANKPSDVAAWLLKCPGCRAQYERTAGLPFVPGQGFAEAGALNVPASAKPITYVAPEIIPPMPGEKYIPLPIEPHGDPSMTASDPRGSLRTGPIPGGTPMATRGLGGLGVGDFVPWGPGRPPGLGPSTFAPTIGPKTVYTPPTDQTGYGILDPLIDLGTDYLRQKLGLGGTPGTGGRDQGFTGGSQCPEGYVWDNGQCVVAGLGGVVQRALPGGQTGVMAQGEAVMGRYGVAMTPAAYAQPTLRCLPGMVLGKDNLCYNKRDLYKRDRKWNPGRKPLLTGGDLNVLRKAKSLAEKSRKAAVAAGYTCRKRK